MRPIKDDPNRIIVFYEKHGNRYFKIDNHTDYQNVMRKIFNERYSLGWYGNLDTLRNDISKHESVIRSHKKVIEELDGIPDPSSISLVGNSRSAIRYNETCLQEAKETKEFLENVIGCENPDLDSIIRFMGDRDSCEYESFEFETLEKTTTC